MNLLKLSSNRTNFHRPEARTDPQKPSYEPKPLDPLPLDLETIEAEAEKATLGQRVADAMAAKVGSWSFLIGQSVVLTGWIGMNLMPGVPHWDASPFILLNLVFSFASAYTAPVVLMSQNRQSEIERKKTEYDRLVNRQTSHNIELLHKKFDASYAQQLQELTQIITVQQQQINELKGIILQVSIVQQESLNEIPVSELTKINQPPSLHEMQVPSSKSPKYSVSFPFNFSQDDSSKTITSIHNSLDNGNFPC